MTANATSVVDLDPHWTAPIYKFNTGEDFLGLFAVQQNLSEDLLPGIITTTQRARYYPFYCWLLAERAAVDPEEMRLAAFIKRREQIFGLANQAWTASATGRPGELGLQGSDTFRNHWRRHGRAAEIPLTADTYLRAPLGGYGTYAGVMRTLGLTRQLDPGREGLLPRGQELARAFEDAIIGTVYYAARETYDTAASIPRAVLEEYGERCHLGGLACGPDRFPTLETLFAFAQRVAPALSAAQPTVGNMTATLGLILDMLDQTHAPITEDDFRRNVAFGLCPDYEGYEPAEPLRSIVAYWQMYQLRSYYVYALYALWDTFLSWLAEEGPATSAAYHAHLDCAVDLSAAAAALHVTLQSRPLSAWKLLDWLEALLDVAGAPGSDRETRCADLAQKSRFALNEDALYRRLIDTQRIDLQAYAGTAWILLSVLYLRLAGLRTSSPAGVWKWAEAGGTRRRSLALFLREIDNHLSAGSSLLDVWAWLNREYIVAQHTITALVKWRDRKANTFHFDYEGGRFEWLENDGPQFSAPRFEQAYRMLADLGLYEAAGTTPGQLHLTQLGQDTLRRALEACRG